MLLEMAPTPHLHVCCSLRHALPLIEVAAGTSRATSNLVPRGGFFNEFEVVFFPHVDEYVFLIEICMSHGSIQFL